MIRTIRGIVDSRISGENTIFAIQKLYDATSKINLGDEPHIRLIKTAHSRLRAQNLILRKGYSDVDITVRSFTLSAVPACLPEGHNARLLALHLLRMERPDIWGRFHEFQAEEVRLLRALEREVVKGETLLNIYKRHNPLQQIKDLDDDQAGYNVLCTLLAELERNFAPQFEIPAARKTVLEREHWEGDDGDQGSQYPPPNELTLAGWERDEEANVVWRDDCVLDTSVEKSDRSAEPSLSPDEHDAAWPSASSDFHEVAQRQPDRTIKPTLEEIDRNARMAIEYDPITASAWQEIQNLPLEFQERFNNGIGTKPNQDANALAAELKASHLKKLRPYDDETANDVLEQVRTISPDAEAEFREVYALLGNRLAVAELLIRIEEKFGVSDATKARQEAERLEQELLERERQEAERLEQERQEAERLEQERQEAERLEQERQEAERLEQERQEKKSKTKYFWNFILQYIFAVGLLGSIIIFAVVS